MNCRIRHLAAFPPMPALLHIRRLPKPPLQGQITRGFSSDTFAYKVGTESNLWTVQRGRRRPVLPKFPAYGASRKNQSSAFCVYLACGHIYGSTSVKKIEQVHFLYSRFPRIFVADVPHILLRLGLANAYLLCPWLLIIFAIGF